MEQTQDLFQTTLFAELNKKKVGENIVLSPLSAYHILALTANGAKNKTLDEMVKTLSSGSLNELNEINKKILEAIKPLETLVSANAVMTKFDPKEEFKKSSENYEATIDKLVSAEQVNKWCSEKTNGKIDKMLDDISLIQMVLLNAIYFKGKWDYPFKANDTREKDFFNLGTTAKKVKMMFKGSHLDYYGEDGIQACKLDYRTDDMSAIIILPPKTVSINDFVAGFTTEKISKIIEGFTTEAKILLHLPKFEIRCSEDLKEPLKKLGMESAFGAADLSGIAEDLYIDQVLQKTFLKVDEEGTEAAAVTMVANCFLCAPPRQETIIEMDVNRPFLFLIRCSKLPKGRDIVFLSKIEKL